ILTSLYAKAVPTVNYPSRKDIQRLTDNIVPPDGFIIKDQAKWSYIKAKVYINVEQWNEIDQPNALKLLCYGRIEYKDIFGQTHETGFCWEWVPSVSGGSFRPTDNTDLNYYT